LNGQLKEAEDSFRLLLNFGKNHGVGFFTQLANLYLSFIRYAKGDMRQGFNGIKASQEVFLKNHVKVWYVTSESMLGLLYTRFITGPSPKLSIVVKNIWFIGVNAFSSDKKAKVCFENAIEISQEIGAKFYLGQALLGLGRLHNAKKRKREAHDCLSEAIKIFQECDANRYLKQANEELASIS
jgi:tetratricopeptide (TPR) repeat protein